MKEKCNNCGCIGFETVDITVSECNQSQYFIRCKKCGLVVFSTTNAPTTRQYFQSIKERGLTWNKFVKYLPNL